MWYKNVGTSFFCFVIMYSFDTEMDRQKDGWIDRKALAIPCVALHAVA